MYALLARPLDRLKAGAGSRTRARARARANQHQDQQQQISRLVVLVGLVCFVLCRLGSFWREVMAGLVVAWDSDSDSDSDLDLGPCSG